MSVLRELPQPQAIRALFFDVGYTMLAPHPSIVTIVSTVCEQRGIPVKHACLEKSLPLAEATLRRIVQNNPWTWSDDSAIEGIWRAYFTELLTPCLRSLSLKALAECIEAVRLVYDQASSYALFPDVLPVLEILRQHHLTLGIISDWGVNLGLILRHHDLIRYFDFAVVSAAVRLSKPDPQLFQTALHRADAIPDYTAHIGDSYLLDILGARAAGITPVLLDRAGNYDPAQLDCLVVRDLYGLLDLLHIPYQR